MVTFGGFVLGNVFGGSWKFLVLNFVVLADLVAVERRFCFPFLPAVGS